MAEMQWQWTPADYFPAQSKTLIHLIPEQRNHTTEGTPEKRVRCDSRGGITSISIHEVCLTKKLDSVSSLDCKLEEKKMRAGKHIQKYPRRQLAANQKLLSLTNFGNRMFFFIICRSTGHGIVVAQIRWLPLSNRFCRSYLVDAHLATSDTTSSPTMHWGKYAEWLQQGRFEHHCDRF